MINLALMWQLLYQPTEKASDKNTGVEFVIPADSSPAEQIRQLRQCISIVERQYNKNHHSN